MNCLQPCNGSNSWQCPGSLEVSFFFFLINLKLLLINFHQFLCLFLFVCLLCFVLLFIITIFFILKEFDVLVKNSKAPSTLNPVIFESTAFFRCLLVSVFKSTLPVHTYPARIRIHSSTQDSSDKICILLILVPRAHRLLVTWS